MSRCRRFKSCIADSWNEHKSLLIATVAAFVVGTIGGIATRALVETIPSNLGADVTLAMLTALLTSGTVFFPLAGVVLTFALSSAKSRLEALQRDRLSVWIAQQEAYIKAVTENKPDISAQIERQFGSTIEECDARITVLEAGVGPLAWMSISVFILVLAQILVSLRAMAEVSPKGVFPYGWVFWSITLLVFALDILASLVYYAALIGRRL